MDYGIRSGMSLSLGMTKAPQGNIQGRLKSLRLGMPRKASPLSSLFIGNFTWSYIFIRHMICVLLEASFCFIQFCLKYQDLKLLNVRESSHSCIIIQLLIDLHLYPSEQFVICSSASLISFRAWWQSYFEEIYELSYFIQIILRVVNSMVFA